jgi:hypothetical protein
VGFEGGLFTGAQGIAQAGNLLHDQSLDLMQAQAALMAGFVGQGGGLLAFSVHLFRQMVAAFSAGAGGVQEADRSACGGTHQKPGDKVEGAMGLLTHIGASRG